MEEYERTASIGPAEILVTICMHREAHGTWEAPALISAAINPQLPV
jgi:hypothetical protein